ncbi:40S ribosomal protein S12 [Perkinsela sp. CCAP 1560/4]|nr:40S ribosomal protein S12 [Perkinsela sp. CCAP 1560/4]|eukprot:KNH09484.1 40S ribosomal protein S12 [Perkinsela sp. CCAP 1560/4]
MADEQKIAIEVAEIPVAEDTIVESEDATSALHTVLQKAIEVNGLVRGFSGVARALDKGVAQLCVLAEDCEEDAYKTLITALAKQNKVNLIRIPERRLLGEYAGLAKFDRDNNIKKVISTSSVAVTDFGEGTKALDRVLREFKKDE